MNSTFKKLNYKDQKQIHILNALDSFQPELAEMKTVTSVKTNLTGAKAVEFFLGFVTMQKEVDALMQRVSTLINGDGLVWFAYPKGSSKKYKCDFNRDTGWAALGKQGFEPVRMVAIDEDWSALRFRKAEHIKTMTRSRALSETGKKKIAGVKKKPSGK